MTRTVARQLVLMLGLGAALSVGLAWLLWLLLDLGALRWRNVSSVDRDGVWTVSVGDRLGAVLVDSQRSAKREWGPEQACGPPDTATAGDLPTAWASLSSDGGPEWLEVEFGAPVVTAHVHVHETCAPGAIVRLSALGGDGSATVLWEGMAPTELPMRIFALAIEPPLSIERLRIDLDAAAVSGWNEIDAVALVDEEGRFHWAIAADASSSYADRHASTPEPWRLAPSWSGTSAHQLPAGAAHDRRCAAAFGFPVPALCTTWSEDMSGWALVQPAFPLRPVWMGLLFDTAFFAALIALLAFLTRPARILQEMLRMRRGACPRCGHDLRFDFVRGCPECGLRRPASLE